MIFTALGFGGIRKNVIPTYHYPNSFEKSIALQHLSMYQV